jgi:hypothetical protein
LIVGLDSLSIGEADDNSMEDPLADGNAADGNAADGNATDGNAADGDMEDGKATMNGLRQMGQRLQFDILELFFMILPATSSARSRGRRRVSKEAFLLVTGHEPDNYYRMM